MASYANQYLLTPLTPSMPLCPSIPEPFEALPITPPDSAVLCGKRDTHVDVGAVQKALHVLANERAALSHLETLYASSPEIQTHLSAAINQIVQAQVASGKVVFTGIGKSRLIALKLVATFVSLGIHSVFLHPTDALHGDLGIIRPNDVVLMITYSGRTSELLMLLPHIPRYVPLIVITSHIRPGSCPLLMDLRRSNSTNILLPAPVHQSEISTFGLAAPTTSTTVALALGDSLALSVADKLHCSPDQTPAQVFAANHPGGAIGAALGQETRPTAALKIADLASKVEDIPIAVPQHLQPLSCLDVLLTAVRSPRGWVRTSPTHIIGPRQSQQLSDPTVPISRLMSGKNKVVIEKTDWISILGDCTVDECREWVIRMREEGDGRGKEFLTPCTVFGIVDNLNEVSGVVEIQDVVGDDFVWT